MSFFVWCILRHVLKHFLQTETGSSGGSIGIGSSVQLTFSRATGVYKRWGPQCDQRKVKHQIFILGGQTSAFVRWPWHVIIARIARTMCSKFKERWLDHCQIYHRYGFTTNSSWCLTIVQLKDVISDQVVECRAFRHTASYPERIQWESLSKFVFKNGGTVPWVWNCFELCA